MLSTDEFNLLIKSANQYYKGLPTELTDREYDELLSRSEIKDITVYLDNIEGDTINHPMNIPVFPKIDDWSRLDELKNSYSEYVITPKYDGCSTIAYYMNGKLTRILTRSNEVNGKDKTKSFWNKYPQEVDTRVLAILGEALVPVCKSKGRADANGLTNSKYLQDRIDSDLEIHAFDVITSEPMSYIDKIKLTNMYHRELTMDEALFINNTGTFDGFYADGIVIYDNSLRSVSDAKILKLHSAKESAITTVVAESLEVSDKTGLLTPKYYLEPVVINNINVKCVGNCGSIDTIESKGLGIGSQVKVHLAKAVIPQISEIISRGKLPEDRTCPVCGSKVERFQGKFICNNPECGIWKGRYKAVNGDIMRFVEPPRAKGDWLHKMTPLQKEYVGKLMKIYKNIKV